MVFNKIFVVILSVVVMGCQSKSEEGGFLVVANPNPANQVQPVPTEQPIQDKTENCAIKFNKEDRLHLTVIKAMQMRQFCHYSKDEIKAMVKAVY